MSEKPQDLKPRTKAFALRIIRMYSELPKNDTVAQVLGKQVLRSGTSVGANYREAPGGRSKAEFISRIGDCLKEIEETEYWLELLVDSGCVSAAKMANSVGFLISDKQAGPFQLEIGWIKASPPIKP
jgi:four helix bundle protein